MRISDVVVGRRVRKHIGDLSDLCESIEKIGLLHPIVVTPDNQLIAGLRRVAAFRKLGKESIPHRVVASLELQPITSREAFAFIEEHHRHHGAPRGFKFAIAVNDGGGEIVGVATAGRPIARHKNDGWTIEVTRVCVIEGIGLHACSKLYAACWRAARAMGYRRAITYSTLKESGASLRAAGYRIVGEVQAQSWHRPGRPRFDKTEIQPRLVWLIDGAA